MGIIARQSIQNTFISYLGVILGFVTTILLYPVILSPEQYGLTRVLVSIATVGAQFGHLGFKNVTIRYFPYFMDSDRGNHGFLFWVVVIPFFGFLLLWLAYALLEPALIQYYVDKSSLFTSYAGYVVPLVLFIIYFEVLNNYVRSLYDSTTGSFLNEVLLRMLIIGVLVIYAYGWIDFSSFVTLFVTIYAVPPLALLVYLGFRGELSLVPDFEFLGPKLVRQIANYAVYALLGGVSTIIVGNIDIIMLASLAGLSDTGIYAIAFYIGSVIAVPKRSIGKIGAPMLARALKERAMSTVEEIYRKSSINQIIAGSLLLIGIWANLDNLFRILPTEYVSGGWVIIVVGLGKLFDMAAGLNGVIILNSRYYRYDLWTILFLVVFSIAANYLLIPPFGILGAAVATAASLIVYNCIKLLIVWYKFGMQPFRLNLIPVVAVAVVTLLIAFQIPKIGRTSVDILCRSSIMTLLYLGPIYYFKVSDDLNRLIDGVLRRAALYFQNYFR